MKPKMLILLCCILPACKKESPEPSPWTGKCGERILYVKFENNRPVEVLSNRFHNYYTYLDDSIIHERFNLDSSIAERHDYSMANNRAVFSVDSYLYDPGDNLRKVYHYTGDTLEVEGFLLGTDSSVYFEYYVLNPDRNLEYSASGRTDIFDASSRTKYEYGNEPNNGVLNVYEYYILGLQSPNLPVKESYKVSFYNEDVTQNFYQFDEQQRLVQVKTVYTPGFEDQPITYNCLIVNYK